MAEALPDVRRNRTKIRRLQELIDHHLENQEPLDCTTEVAILRALLDDLVERWEDIYGVDGALLAWHEDWKNGNLKGNPKPRQLPDFSSVSILADRISAIAERQHKMRQKETITIKTLYEIIEQLGIQVVDAVRTTGIDRFTAARLLDEIQERWGQFAPSTGDGSEREHLEIEGEPR